MNLGRSALVGATLLFASLFGVSPASAQFWQCAPYARMISGIDIHGNAGTWWGQAAGRYDRGDAPAVGAVMVMKPYGKMRVGHVATVSRVLSDREIAVTHANWSRRGGVERDVRVVDVSAAGDWSKVKVWFAAQGDVGQTSYPTFGFIYPKRAAAIQFAEAGGATMRGATLR